MAILALLGVWMFNFWIDRRCLRRPAAGIKGSQRRPRIQVLDTVPSEWIEAYRGGE
jgi:hypothetical protein